MFFFTVNLNSFTGIALAMSDKGGHGFSLPNGKGVKSSLKSTTPLKKDGLLFSFYTFLASFAQIVIFFLMRKDGPF